ncbi:MAG: ABC transporter ATP-binding protein/permease [Firmicutes bacterium]|nr:ABC transporter ATP-binding protein/permease [[Eubacterium] siraeum]MCM1489014.1 ABC transporter ATP-binding protein/permease [Bacillota bacterium]
MAKDKSSNSIILKRILRFSKPHLGYLAAAALCSVINVALTLYIPILIGRAIDCAAEAGKVDFAAMTPILIRLGVSAAIGALASWLMNLCTNKITYLTVMDIRRSAFDKLQAVPLSYIDSHPHGDIISRMITDTDQISDGLLMGFTQLFTGIVTILGTLGFMLSINPLITLIVVVITPLSFFVASFVAKHSFDMFRKQSETRGKMTSLTEEMIGSQHLVKAFSFEENAEKQFEAINRDLQEYSVKAIFFSSLTNPSTRFVNGLIYAGVGVFGAVSALSGHISVGQLSCFLTYANQYTKPFNEISGVITELQSALASAKRVFEVIDAEAEAPDSENALVLTPENVDGNIDIKNVSFCYNPERPLIEGLDLKVLQGQRIAIVGPTGCGKTTLINLLMRFYDVNGGEIAVSGTPIKEITRDSLRSSYGMVLQETWLKSGTVFENIAYGKPDAAEEEVVAAAKAAHAHSFIQRLPQGYNTKISDDETNISQGQKQLLCIARVMLCLPPMLILDEATSSIDTMTEIRIQKAFAKMMKGRTSFIVAHRLSTIKEADCILVMESGHIIEMGKHEELIEKGGFYANLYNSQFNTDDRS